MCAAAPDAEEGQLAAGPHAEAPGAEGPAKFGFGLMLTE